MGLYPRNKPLTLKPGSYLGEGRLQHVTEDVELFEVPCLVSQIFNDWVGGKKSLLISDHLPNPRAIHPNPRTLPSLGASGLRNEAYNPPHLQIEETGRQNAGELHLLEKAGPRGWEVSPPQEATLTAGIELATPLVSCHPVLHLQLQHLPRNYHPHSMLHTPEDVVHLKASGLVHGQGHWREG